MSNLLPTENNEESIPKWSYGIIFGGLTGIAIAGVTMYHYISKRVRQQQAQNEVKEINKESLRTPRDESNKFPITAIF